MAKTMQRSFRAAVALSLMFLAASGSQARAADVKDWAEEGEWSVMPPPEGNDGGVQRDGTLRIVRFGFDGQDPLEDQGTVVGWVNRAASGTLVQRQEEGPVDALIEIVKRMPSSGSPSAE